MLSVVLLLPTECLKCSGKRNSQTLYKTININSMNDISQLSPAISVLEITYVIASVLFILGLKMLSHPLTARRGNTLAAAGVVLAIIATILFHQKDGKPIGNIGYILAAIAIGTIIISRL